MEQAEIDQFVMTGRNAMTILASGGEQMAKWAASFEQRGGEPVFGAEALEIVYLSNAFQEWLTPERAVTIARLRTDV